MVGPVSVCTADTARYYFMGNTLHQSCSWAVEGGSVIASQDADTVTVVWTAPGTGRITLFAANTSERCTVPAELEVAVNPLPDAAVAISGNLLIASPGISHQWYFNDLPVPDSLGGKERELVYFGEGYYRVRVTSSQGCSALSEAYLLNAVDPHTTVADNGIVVYPNPFREELSIEFTHRMTGTIKLRISDIFARNVVEVTVPATSAKIHLSLPLAPGVYFLNLVSRDRTWRIKIIRD
jgi:hypothetical protein